jgi:hypothetical protein
MEAALRGLREGGYGRRMAHHGFHALDVFVVGYVRQDDSFDFLLEPVLDGHERQR